jgi:hypothetical protein
MSTTYTVKTQEKTKHGGYRTVFVEVPRGRTLADVHAASERRMPLREQVRRAAEEARLACDRTLKAIKESR